VTSHRQRLARGLHPSRSRAAGPLAALLLFAGACGGVSEIKPDGGRDASSTAGSGGSSAGRGGSGGSGGSAGSGGSGVAGSVAGAGGSVGGSTDAGSDTPIDAGDDGAPDGNADGGASDAGDASTTDASDGGPLSGKLDVCVLDAPPPTGKCVTPAVLDFGSHSPGMPLMRLFRVDNGTAQDAVFDSATVASAQFTVTTVRYEPDPGNAGAYLRVAQTLPATRPSRSSLYFEVSYTTGMTPGALPANEVHVAYRPNPADAGDLVVPISGTIIMCPTGTGACDTNPSNGCETNVTNDAANCGTCGKSCAAVFPQSEVACMTSTCQFVKCLPNNWDLNANTADGCEYACTPAAGPDLPDDTFADTNCDGVDGDVAAAIFVATSGADTNPGTMAQPVATIAAGIAKAATAGKTQVYISSGSYQGRVTLTNGISLYGGYSQATGWKRAAANTTTIVATAEAGGRLSAVEGFNVTSATTIDRLSIQSGNAVTAGASSYGFYCSGCTALTLRNSVIVAGRGAAGTRGYDGPNGMSGANGIMGGFGMCDAAPQGIGGPGGALVCSGVDVGGGKGGDGGPQGSNSGMLGGSGKNGGGAGGPAGFGGDPGVSGGRGQNGATVVPGTPGGGGSLGGLMSGFWIGTAGLNGGAGPHGRGGGGGGGGGGQGCTFCVDGAGNGGGGGGSGGCGGGAGTGGIAGGGSFGLFLVNSTGFVVTGCSITSGNGGNGGGGGNGGIGGGPGIGLPGGLACTAEVGQGGAGGDGSKGGDGGGGGGGAGGPSFAIYRSNTTASLTSNTLTIGLGGAGGPGGTPNGNSGVAGLAATLF
jgi:hypothetical protein